MADLIDDVRARLVEYERGTRWEAPYVEDVSTCLAECDRLRAALAEAEAKLAEVTGERDVAVRMARNDLKFDMAGMRHLLADLKARQIPTVTLHHHTVDSLMLRAVRAESALARALAAMPTDKERPAISEIAEASYFKVPNGVGWRLFSGWLARLDAFRASQAETKGGEDG